MVLHLYLPDTLERLLESTCEWYQIGEFAVLMDENGFINVEVIDENF